LPTAAWNRHFELLPAKKTRALKDAAWIIPTDKRRGLGIITAKLKDLLGGLARRLKTRVVNDAGLELPPR
jgi:hypothetical protein